MPKAFADINEILLKLMSSDLSEKAGTLKVKSAANSTKEARI
jgi:hypothetical protein